MAEKIAGEEFLCKRCKSQLELVRRRHFPPKKIGPGGYYFARVWMCPNQGCGNYGKPYLLDTDKRYVTAKERA